MVNTSFNMYNLQFIKKILIIVVVLASASTFMNAADNPFALEYDLSAYVTIEEGETKVIDPASLNTKFRDFLVSNRSFWGLTDGCFNYDSNEIVAVLNSEWEKGKDTGDGNYYVIETSCTILGLSPGSHEIDYLIRHKSGISIDDVRNYVQSQLKIFITVKASDKPKLTLTPSNTGAYVPKGTVITFTPSVPGADIYNANSYRSKLPSVTINETTSVEVRAVLKGYPCSDIFSHTYYVGEGIYFTEDTPEGISIQYKVTDNSAKTCEVCYVPVETSGTVTIPRTAKGFAITGIGEKAFDGCLNITKIELPQTISSIGKYAFARCQSLPEIKLPDALEALGEKAFYWCTTLSHIEIPNGVKTIEKSVFSRCTRLKSIEIPSTITSIKGGAFWSCI